MRLPWKPNPRVVLDLLIRACGTRAARRAADRLCLNVTRLSKAEAVEAVVAAVVRYYEEHRIEASLAARQAKTYQRIHFRHRVRAIRDRIERDPDRGELRERAGAYEALSRELKDLHETGAIVEHLARYYADDMLPDFDPAFFVAFRSIARRIFPNFVRSIRTSEDRPGTIDRIRDLAGAEPVFFLPNHVSNADHVPVCFALNDLGVLHPLIAAGANLFRGVSAEIMPRVNAYKIRREEIGADSRWFYQVKWFHNPVYRRVHTEFLHNAWNRNEPFLFYLEGTRSRTGAIGKPKLGIVRDVLEYVRETGRTAHLVPISLSYTVVPEDVEIEAARRGEEISKRDIITQLARLDRQYRRYREAPIRVRFSAPLTLGAEPPDAAELADRVTARIRKGIEPSSTSLLARAALALAREDDGGTWFREVDVRGRVEEDELERALAIFADRGFVAGGESPGEWRVEAPELLEQYARRIDPGEGEPGE